MATVAQLAALADYAKARQGRAAADGILSTTRAAIADTTRALEDARARADALNADLLQMQVEALTKRLQREQQSLADLQAVATKARDAALAGGAGFDLLSSRHPLLLLPVRLETRFAWMRAGQITFDADAALERVLLVRVYPDEIHDDSHDPHLTAEETEALVEFRKKLLLVRDLQPLQDLWKELAARVGPMRAQWIGEAAIARLRPARRATRMSLANIARLLPDRWVAVAAMQDGSVLSAMSRPLAEPLETGPSPEGMAWMTEFAAAEKAGMAIVIRNLPAGIDVVQRLRVVGVRGTLNPAESQIELQQLIRAHQFTRGFELVAPGTPTNSLPGARAGYSSRPSPGDIVDVNQRRYLIGGASAPLCQQGDESDGWALASALGVEVSTFGFVKRADATDQRDARMIRTLLAAATERTLIRHLAAVIEADTVRELLAFGAQRVSALGPLPALRVGPQPYGILPVLRRDQGRVRANASASRYLPTLDRLRATWEAASAGVDRVGRPGADPSETLIRILQHDAVTRRLAFRPFVSRDLALEATRDLDPRAERDLLRQRRAASARFANLGIEADAESALVQALHLNIAPPLTVPLVQAADAAPGSVQRSVQYLEIAATLRVDALFKHDYAGGERPRPLLYAVARLAMLEQADRRARELLIAAGADPARWDDEDLPNQFNDFHASMIRRLESPDPQDPIWSIATHLSEIGREAWVLAELRGILRTLKLRPPALLEELLRASLGLFGTRLDAWYTALATEELAIIRDDPATATGISIGAYGVLDEIRQSPRRRVSGTADLFTNPFNAGYVHAPSVNQGAAAAVMRSVHVAHATSSHGDAFSVDLSSARVRAGLELAEGVRAGQPLAALVGYRIERELRAAQLARLIAPLRAVAPLVANRLTPSTQPAESVAASNVVDGLTLLAEAGYDGRQSGSVATLWSRQPSLGAALSQTEQDAFTRVLAAAEEGIDALADLALSESVYQAVLGNPGRAGGAVDSLSGAPVPPADFAMVRTPRSGIGVTHRVVVLLGDDTKATPVTGWSEAPRALAEPRLEAWAQTILPRPAAITLRARFTNAAGDEVARLDDVTLDGLLAIAAAEAPHLRLCALDVVALADPASQPQRSALETRIAALLELARPQTAGIATLELVFDRHDDWDATDFGIVETLEIAKGLRDLLGQARPLGTADVARAGRSSESAIDTADLARRADAAVGSLGDLILALESAASSKSAEMRTQLFLAESYGIAGAAPVSLSDPADEELATRVLNQLKTQVTTVVAEAKRRLGLANAAAADDSAAWLKAVFGEGFVVLPTLVPAEPTTDLFQQAAVPAGGDEPAARTWLSRAARVRENVGRLNEVLGSADAVVETITKGERHVLRVAQIGGAPGEHWAALPLLPGTLLPGGRVSIVAVTPADGLRARNVAGLLVDEWVEVVPDAMETTSVAFHYDAPTSTPPQVMLLGLPYPTQETWTAADVIEVVDEALALSRIRMVTLDGLPDLGQLVPLFITPENPAGDLAGLDIESLTRPETA